MKDFKVTTSMVPGFAAALLLLLLVALVQAAPIPPNQTRGSQGDPCAATAALSFSPSADQAAALFTLRGFRDSILASTPGGREVVGLYYRHNDRVLALLASDQLLRIESARFVSTVVPALDAMMTSRDDRTIITHELVQSSERFFQFLAVTDELHGGKQLASDIRLKLQQLSPNTLVGATVNEALQRLKPAC